MTQIYDGTVQVPVTVIEAGPCPVLQIKTIEQDGYNAIQIGFGLRRISEQAKRNAIMPRAMGSLPHGRFAKCVAMANLNTSLAMYSTYPSSRKARK